LDESAAMKLPDFIIAGVAKCATSSLHFILSKHPDIFIPDREVHYFSRADYSSLYRDESPFKGSMPGQVIGEDSPGYLISERAPEQISKLVPDAKIIIMLRDPASRTYSAYWHRVRTGRAIHDFEKSLLHSPYSLIEQSLYKDQIERFTRFIPRENMHFILFEEFIRDTPATIDRVLDYIGVPRGKIDFGQIDTHYQPALVPRYPILQLWRNRFLGRRRFRGFDRLFYTLSPHLRIKPPPMNPVTRMLLNAYFAQENSGLDELTGLDLESHWYKEGNKE